MAITSITIENFKCIGDAVTIPIRPLTLLFGKNSSGKSTVFQAVIYGLEIFHRMLSNEPLDELNEVNIIRGFDYTIRGDFSSLVHSYDLERKIHIRIEFSIAQVPDTEFDMNSGWVEVTVGWNTDIDNIDASGILGLNDEELMSFDPKKITTKEKWVRLSKDSLLYWNTYHPFSQYLRNPKIKSEEKIYSFIYFFNYIYNLIHWLIYHIGPIRNMPSNISSKHKETEQPRHPDDSIIVTLKEKILRITSPLNKSSEQLETYITSIPDILQTIKDCDISRVYLGQEQIATVSTSGLSYYLSLQKDSSGKLLETINGYMKSNLGYTIRDIPCTNEIRLYDENKKIYVGFSDVGTGIGQVIPIIVGVQLPPSSIYMEFSSSLLDHVLKHVPGPAPPTLFAVEQPELHLHPAAQVALGDVFIDGIKNSNRTMLIETHSEHLLLRIMRRMRETFEGRIEENRFPITPDDVAVLFVESHNSQTIIREMPINERGDLVKAWPGGFFEEDIEEVLA